MKQSLFLNEMEKLHKDGTVTLGEIAAKLKGKGLVFLSLICVLPFMQPIPIPGLSTLLGFVIVLQGIGLTLAGRPLLTQKMKAIELPAERVAAFVRGAKKVFPWVGWMVRERGQTLVQHRATQIVAGITLTLLSLFLSLPLPLPSSNFLPAIGIFLICLGLLEDDFLLVVLGVTYSVLFGWLLSVSFHVLWAELSHSSWWGRYF